MPPIFNRIDNPAEANAQPKKGAAALNHHCKVIAVWNYKGGASKTTTTRELAAEMVRQGKRVAVVDADAQGNLTTCLLTDHPAVLAEQGNAPAIPAGPVVFVDPGRAQKTVPQQKPCVKQEALIAGCRPWNVLQQRNNANNVYQAVLNIYFSAPNLFQDNIVELSTIDIPRAFHAKGGRLWLLSGSPEIVNLETYLQSAVNMRQGLWLGAFRALFNKMAAERNLDYILVDCSPSSGFLNQLIVMSCDYILPPAVPDYGNLSSLHGMLEVVLPKWCNFQNDVMRGCHLPPGMDEFEITHTTKLLPVTVNNFKKGTKDPVLVETTVTAQPSQWIAEFHGLLLAAAPEVQAMMVPQMTNVTGGNQERPCMVFAFIQQLGAVLGLASEHRWPLCWWSDDSVDDEEEEDDIGDDDTYHDAEEKSVDEAEDNSSDDEGLVHPEVEWDALEERKAARPGLNRRLCSKANVAIAHKVHLKMASLVAWLDYRLP